MSQGVLFRTGSAVVGVAAVVEVDSVVEVVAGAAAAADGEM